MDKINVKQINTKDSFREACSSYTLPKLEIPIKGGWGFCKEEAIIIDKNNIATTKNSGFDWIELEYAIIDKLIHLEFFHLQNEEDRYRNIQWKIIQQELVKEQGSIFDKFLIRITALPLKAYISRRREWKENGRKPDFDKDWFLKKSQELTQYCEREYWFEITNSFNTSFK